MVNINFTALFCSNKNVSMAYKIKKHCRECNINIINTTDIIDLTIKVLKFLPQFIFFDCSTLTVSPEILSSFLSAKEYKNSKIILIYSEISQLNPYEKFNFESINQKNIATFICENATKYKLQHLLENKTSYKDNKNSNYEAIVSYLFTLGFSAKHTGYSYLLEIMKHIVSENGVIGSLYRDVYPAIAIKFKTRLVNVERNIRNAIDKAWESAGENVWKKELGDSPNFKKPSNREFICMLCHKYVNEAVINKNKIISA